MGERCSVALLKELPDLHFGLVFYKINISPLRGFFSDGLLTDSRSRREELAGVTHRPPPIIKNSSAPKFRSETSHEPFNQERKS